MKRLASLLEYLKHHRDAALLGGAVVLLLVALLRPTVEMRRDIYSYMLVVDITQSMNVVDMKVDGNRVLCEYIWAGAIGNVTEVHC